MQRAVNTTIEEDVFSTVPFRDYMSGTERNQMRMRMGRAHSCQGMRVRLKIECELM
jgi:hypothetical protein